LNRQTGNRLKQQNIDPETDEVVDRADQVRGYEIAKGEYIFVEDEDIAKVKIESTHTIDIAKFVPKSEVDPRYLETPYYIAPDDRVAHEPFAVIREAMRAKAMVGIGRVVISNRERVVMLEPLNKGIVATVLRYGTEVRDDWIYFNELPNVEIPPDMKSLAEVIIEKMSGHFDSSEFVDRYEDAIVEMLKEKRAGHEFKPVAEAKPRNVINLMDALRKSIDEELKAAGKPALAPKKEADEPVAKVRAPSKVRETTKKPATKRAKA
jgi:DNA end-binding protein Ku